MEESQPALDGEILSEMTRPSELVWTYNHSSRLDFIHSGSVTDGVYQAVKEGTWYFYHVVLRLGG